LAKSEKTEKKAPKNKPTEIDELIKENDEIIKELEELRASNESLNTELSEQKETFLRTVAEYDNYRKRTVKEKEDAYLFAKADTVAKLIPAIDSFERSLENTGDNLEDYKKGVDMTYRQIMDILLSLNTEAFGAAGDEFNPDFHNAVMHKEDESIGANIITEVFQKGYKVGDKVIRPAMVAVAN